jgi:hypothetical protein
MPRFLKFVVANEMLDGTDVPGELFREGSGRLRFKDQRAPMNRKLRL